jgi:hypothetical protein
VVRTARPNSLGIEFIKFLDNDRERLQLFIRGLLTGRVVPPELRNPSLSKEAMATSTEGRGAGARA